ncbi:phage polarity suppression protein [Cronobacter malonaticus]|uniref:phage polarity suppression protein n=1 Tax=Cronobacter malonaticus TaxID=413503 RepID=UPI0005187432|nr:phage polarity suppression protein [Cronobacter malonaticus]EGT4385357.1 Polarity suppression protein [Cronobacter malonaticus]EGT4422742.1 Polarity suppression protein [Cronobacter malonaticus]EGT4455845.1 Polarity suppression protein [Cronobacter malonaticus]ELY4806575.1 Polarity suppression protein [Cronobacter malonaticus]MDI6407022.1 phage polarity suppression protein [Cronobacter malonaticus]
MTTLQKAFETCQADKSAWLQRRAELVQTEQAYREQLAADNRNGQRLQMLREIIDVKKWEINRAAGRYIRSHEGVQRISIRNRLNDFMQAHGASLAAALAPELMNYSGQHPAVQHCAMQHSLDYLREALQAWLSAGEKINYSAQDEDILTAIGFRPDAASRDDNREKFTPAQNLNYTHRRAELVVHQNR